MGGKKDKEVVKVYLNVTDINPNGVMTISFSEQLLTLEHLGKLNISTLNLLKDQILANVTFICNTPEEFQDYKPNITDWLLGSPRVHKFPSCFEV